MNHLKYFFAAFLLLFSAFATVAQTVKNSLLEIAFVNNSNYLWQYTVKESGETLGIKPPSFEVNGKQVVFNLGKLRPVAPEYLLNGVTAYAFEASCVSNPSLKLQVVFQLSNDNPVVRFKYIVLGSKKDVLTKKNNHDNISYVTASLASFDEVTEVQFSNYDEKFHSYILKEQPVEPRFFENNEAVMGPMLVAENKRNAFLLAYEHGSLYGNNFLHFAFAKDNTVKLNAVKGNYFSGQSIADRGFETLWFEVAGVAGDKEKLAKQYRSFVLKYISQNNESRKPYIFYNTWGRQERSKWVGGTYLETMNLKTTLQEIEKAHMMGVDVYVIDAGWFSKTGDWAVNTTPEFFPDTLKQVVQLLKKYNMKLGLWFNPTVAALSSQMLKRNLNNRTTIDGNMGEPSEIWETEKSVSLCLISNYWEDFSDVLIRLVKEYGVTYFKWDAIGQGNCNSPNHFHGNAENSAQERLENNAFLLPIYMSKIIDKVCKAEPKAIFDFDITEEGRSVGLSFLSSGKYFAINNGPYYHNYDISETWKSPLANGNPNIFVYPGPARGWIARQVLAYDKWIPSVLFLTHYQPDEPRKSQLINMASLILGQNGIWGNILNVSDEATALFGNILNKYKQVKNDILISSPVVKGKPGEMVEIHEKINPDNGQGAVVIFGIGQRDINYVTEAKVNRNIWHNENVSVSYDERGRAIIKTKFTETGTKIIYFGVKN